MKPDTENSIITSRRTVAPAKRGALGKGLGALIPGKAKAEQRDYFECPINRIKATPDQPRRIFEEQALGELVESIRRSGIIQPLVVRQDGADYRLIAGERRLRAARRLALESVPVVIKDVDPDEAFVLALVENIQRQDLNPVEEAEAYQRLMTMRDYTQEDLAEDLGKSRSTVANTLRLLNLSAPIQDRIASGELSGGAARAILALPEEADRETVAEAAVAQGLTVRQLESLARRVKSGEELTAALKAEVEGEPVPVAAQPRATARARTKNTNKAQLDLLAPPPELTAEDVQDRGRVAAEIAALLGARVDLYDDDEGGSFEVFFDNDDELAALLTRLRKLR